MQKFLFPIIIISGIVLIGGIIYFTLPAKQANYNVSGADNSMGSHMTDNMMIHPTGNIKEFNVRSFNWNFSPATIEVSAGDKVILHVTTDDIDHGLAINEFLVNKRIQPGQTTEIEFMANKRGTFDIYCSVPCGEGHLSMKGKLVVK